MARAGPEALATLQETIRQLRAIAQLREKQPGTFYLVGQAFVHFHDDGGRLHADLKKPSGTGFDVYPVDTAPEQRKFVDEAKRRAAKPSVPRFPARRSTTSGGSRTACIRSIRSAAGCSRCSR